MAEQIIPKARVIVCGGRKFGDLASLKDDRSHPEWAKREDEYKFVYGTLNRILPTLGGRETKEMGWIPEGITIISGKAKGVDSVAIDWAVVNWCFCEEFPADWNRWGLKAGSIRNQQMLDEGKPTHVISFPGGPGTADMIRRAERHGIPVIKVKYDEA